MSLAASVTLRLVRPERTALEAIAEVRTGHMSPRDLVEEAIARIEEVDGRINAIPVRAFERARTQAQKMTEGLARGGEPPPLCGLPLAVKDNSDVASVPTSGGSPITSGRLPTESDPAISRLEGQGAITLGKTNLSELGGANTVNSLFGATLNPFDTTLTVGGSSGGSAAALATGQVYLAHGNDVGGSLRTPAAFCGVAGLRPTPGLVPRKRAADPFDQVFVEGPMARTIADLGLMLDIMAGYEAHDLLSRPSAGGYLAAATRPEPPARLAVSCDLGVLPVSRAIRDDFTTITGAIAVQGVTLEAAQPDFSGLLDTIRTLRAAAYASNWQEHWPIRAHDFTYDVADDIVRGLALSGAQIAAATRRRGEFYRRMIAFFAHYAVLVTPVTQVKPFPVIQKWPSEIDGIAQDHYTDWIAITYAWSILGCPALAVSLGCDAEGLPMAVQLIGPPRSEPRLLAVAAWLEASVHFEPPLVTCRAGTTPRSI